MAGCWHAHTLRRSSPPKLQLVPGPSQAHDIARHRGGGWECRKCGRRSMDAQTLQVEFCMGHAAARIPAQVADGRVTSNGHRLWRTADVVWCCICGRNTSRRLAKLREDCPGRPTQPWRLANLKAGRAAKARASDPPIGRPAPLAPAEWEDWQLRDAESGAGPGR